MSKKKKAQRRRLRATLAVMGNAVDAKDAERLLRVSHFEDARSLWWSSNYVYLSQMTGPEGESFAAVYKPHSGESPLWDFPDGLYKREVAAYELARLLEWPLVPPTVLRDDGPKGPGSLQVFIPHDQQQHFFEQREKPDLVPQLQRMAVFDFVANNADRKGGHCLLAEDGHIWGIDHGLCFHTEYKMRTVIWDWADEAIDPAYIGDICRVGELLEARAPESDRLRELLTPHEVAMIVARIATLVQSGKFPLPGPHRHYPWPLV